MFAVVDQEALQVVARLSDDPVQPTLADLESLLDHVLQRAGQIEPRVLGDATWFMETRTDHGWVADVAIQLGGRDSILLVATVPETVDFTDEFGRTHELDLDCAAELRETGVPIEFRLYPAPDAAPPSALLLAAGVVLLVLASSALLGPVPVPHPFLLLFAGVLSLSVSAWLHSVTSRGTLAVTHVCAALHRVAEEALSTWKPGAQLTHVPSSWPCAGEGEVPERRDGE